MEAGTGDESPLSCVKRATRSSRRRSPAWASGHICSALRLTWTLTFETSWGVLKYEDLHDLILVGHSYAGMIITAIAEQAPERLSHLVYLDALIPKYGESLIDVIVPDFAATFHVPIPPIEWPIR